MFATAGVRMQFRSLLAMTLALGWLGTSSLLAADKPAAETKKTAGAAADTPADSESVARIVLAGGCFWCTEAVFEELDGVQGVVSGYCGGTEKTANYRAVSTGRTAHAEAIEITYDPAKISYEQLLEVFFDSHDPTTKDQQGADIGPQYRSAIFYATPEEQKIAAAKIAELDEAKKFKRPIVTTLEPLKKFYVAEESHQDYASRYPTQPYIRGVSSPKVRKIREKYAHLLKKADAK